MRRWAGVLKVSMRIFCIEPDLTADLELVSAVSDSAADEEAADPDAGLRFMFSSTRSS